MCVESMPPKRSDLSEDEDDEWLSLKCGAESIDVNLC